MPKKMKWKLFDPEDQVEVQMASDMDEETFLKHLEHRHADAVKFETVPVARRALDAWIPTYRAFHDRLHTLGPRSQFDHTHDEEEG
jgi:hypothetical protein